MAFETIEAATGSGFRFVAEAFAGMVATGDFAAMDRFAQASLYNAATLEALERSARQGVSVTLERG